MVGLAAGALFLVVWFRPKITARTVVLMAALGSDIQVTGVCVRRIARDQFDRIKMRLQQIADLLGVDPVAGDDDILFNDVPPAPGYGQLNESTLAAIKIAAWLEGLILDPVYTGKAMAGFLQRAEATEPGKSLLFIHTGGQPSLFTYQLELSEALG